MANSNYLNPSLFSLGVDDLKDSYIGWILVGKNNVLTDEEGAMTLDSSNFPYSDGNIAGLMSPTKVVPSSTDDTGTLTKGTIGYYIDSNSAGKNDIILTNEIDNSNINSKNKESFNIGVENGVFSSGTTKLFVNIDSTSSTILPPNVGSDYKDNIYIDIGSGTGKLLLVKYTDKVNDDNIDVFLSSERDSSPLKDLRDEYDESNLFDTENGTTWVKKYINKVLFVYDVNPSNGDRCNDWNYTGFSVGKIEVTLSGLNS